GDGGWGTGDGGRSRRARVERECSRFGESRHRRTELSATLNHSETEQPVFFPPSPVPHPPSPDRLTHPYSVDNFRPLDLVKVFTKLGDTCSTRTSRSCSCSASSSQTRC